MNGKELIKFLEWMSAKRILPVSVRFRAWEEGGVYPEMIKVWEPDDLVGYYLEEEQQADKQWPAAKPADEQLAAADDDEPPGWLHPDELPEEVPLDSISKRNAFIQSLLRHWVIQGMPCSMRELARHYGMSVQVLYHESRRMQKGGIVLGKPTVD